VVVAPACANNDVLLSKRNNNMDAAVGSNEFFFSFFLFRSAAPNNRLASIAIMISNKTMSTINVTASGLLKTDGPGGPAAHTCCEKQSSIKTPASLRIFFDRLQISGSILVFLKGS
jgi:hypothetical protein